MPSAGGKGGGGQATNADLQADEDIMNRIAFRGKYFREWAAKKREKRQAGPMIIYSKSPAPPRK